MQTIFVMVKCQLGKAYEVADDACTVEQVSEVYSTSGQYALLKKIFGRLTEAELQQMHALFGRLDSACSECD